MNTSPSISPRNPLSESVETTASSASSTTHVPNEHDDPHASPWGSTGLKEIKSEMLFGLVWINMNDDAQPLEDFLGHDLVNELSSYRMEDMVRVLNITADIPCNWKIITDNFNQAYHVQVLHSGLPPYIEANWPASLTCFRWPQPRLVALT